MKREILSDNATKYANGEDCREGVAKTNGKALHQGLDGCKRSRDVLPLKTAEPGTMSRGVPDEFWINSNGKPFDDP